ncbi:hypothetical protein FRC03_004796, partial [Tulasnella sp. 419]
RAAHHPRAMLFPQARISHLVVIDLATRKDLDLIVTARINRLSIPTISAPQSIGYPAKGNKRQGRNGEHRTLAIPAEFGYEILEGIRGASKTS